MVKIEEKGLGAQTRIHVYNLLHKMYEDSIHHFEWRKTNPVLKKYKPKLITKERSFLKSEEAKTLLRSCRSKWFGPGVWLGILAGLRPCETQALRWDKVDLEAGRILISSAYKWKEKRIEDFPKQGDWGEAPIPAPLKKYLLELKDMYPQSEFVAQGANGEMLSYHSFLPALKRECSLVGLKQITPHELRHTATEVYYDAGASSEDLTRLLNHKSSRSTGSYIHRTDERLGRIAGQIQL